MTGLRRSSDGQYTLTLGLISHVREDIDQGFDIKPRPLAQPVQTKNLGHAEGPGHRSKYPGPNPPRAEIGGRGEGPRCNAYCRRRTDDQAGGQDGTKPHATGQRRVHTLLIGTLTAGVERRRLPVFRAVVGGGYRPRTSSCCINWSVVLMTRDDAE